MSAFESIIWHILGYLAMPTIFIAGFVAVFLVTVVILKFFGKTAVEDHSQYSKVKSKHLLIK